MSEIKTPLSAEAAKNDVPPNMRALMPRVDVLEDEAGITILADLPGVAKEQLELKIEGDVLGHDALCARDSGTRLRRGEAGSVSAELYAEP